MGVDWVCSLRKILMRLYGTKLFIDCTSSTHFAPSSMQYQNIAKCTENATQRNKTRVQDRLGWIGCVHCKKFQGDFMARTCALIAPVQPILHQILCSNERLPNAPKHYETHPNMSLGSNGVDRVDSLQKNPMQIRGTKFCINCSSSACFVTSFMQSKNNTKCTQTL